MLDKILSFIADMFTVKSVACIRTENSYINAASFRFVAKRAGNTGYLIANIQLSAQMPTGTGLTKVGMLNAHLKDGMVATVPAQVGNATLLLQVQANGTIEIANLSGVAAPTGFYRAVIPLAFA